MKIYILELAEIKMSILGKLDFWCSTWQIDMCPELCMKMSGMVNHSSNDQIIGAADLNQMTSCPILQEK